MRLNVEAPMCLYYVRTSGFVPYRCTAKKPMGDRFCYIFLFLADNGAP
jgi:hypothetical protein